MDLPSPGLVDAERGATDCDLDACPLTNTMPIRRLCLLGQNVSDTTPVMAWVDVPSLRTICGDQVHGSGTATTPGTVRYASYSGDYAAEITLDVDDVVVDYPQLARRVQIPS
ncbi:hypothetical protein GM708_16900 [Vibrio cholerae]|nr:hypothetical protein [Vibrio cholerae]